MRNGSQKQSAFSTSQVLDGALLLAVRVLKAASRTCAGMSSGKTTATTEPVALVFVEGILMLGNSKKGIVLLMVKSVSDDTAERKADDHE